MRTGSEFIWSKRRGKYTKIKQEMLNEKWKKLKQYLTKRAGCNTDINGDLLKTQITLLMCYFSICSPFAGNTAALAPKRELSPGDYHVVMRIYDVAMVYQDSSLDVEVCECQGAVSTCFIPRSAPRLHISSLATPVLGAIFGLLCT